MAPFLTLNQKAFSTLMGRSWAFFLWAEKIWSISGLHLDSAYFVLLVLHPSVPHFSPSYLILVLDSCCLKKCSYRAPLSERTSISPWFKKCSPRIRQLIKYLTLLYRPSKTNYVRLCSTHRLILEELGLINRYFVSRVTFIFAASY